MKGIEITRRALLGAAAAAALGLAGCNAPAQQTAPEPQAGQEPQKTTSQTGGPAKTAEVGERVEFKGQYGGLAVTVEGFAVSEEQTNLYVGSGNLKDGLAIGLLKLVVENVSYSDGTDYVQLDPSLYCEGDDGVGMTSRGDCYDYDGGYEAVAGAYLPLREGQSKRIALPYDVDPDIEFVTVVAGDTEIKVDVEQE